MNLTLATDIEDLKGNKSGKCCALPAMMKYLFLIFLLGLVLAKYSKDGHNIAVYWGQGPLQKSLGHYCERGVMDIVLLSFVNNFKGNNATYDFGNGCEGKTCKTIAKDINRCQKNGVKVIMSLGGGIGDYGVVNYTDAQQLTETMYQMFGPGGYVFPGAAVDGLDLDIEHGANTGYIDFVEAVKARFGKEFIITAAPQCPFPDENIGQALAKSQIDIAFIQFYNNYCNLNKEFNWDVWAEQVTSFKNPDMKLYIGLPGSVDSAGSGYVNLSTVETAMSQSVYSKNFGGFLVWDAVRGFSNLDEGTAYLPSLRKLILDRIDKMVFQRQKSQGKIVKIKPVADPQVTLNQGGQIRLAERTTTTLQTTEA